MCKDVSVAEETSTTSSQVCSNMRLNMNEIVSKEFGKFSFPRDSYIYELDKVSEESSGIAPKISLTSLIYSFTVTH